MSAIIQGPKPSRRDAFLGGAMLLTAGVAWARMPRDHVIAVEHGSLEGSVPERVGAWGPAPDGGVVLPPEDEQFAAKVYEEQVVRTFVHDNDPEIMLVIAYARTQSGMLMVHRPESCYPGSGFTITADYPVHVPLKPGLSVGGRFLSTRLDARIEQVLYWTRLGDQFPQDWHAERRYLALQNLRGLAPDGALIRLSTIDPDANSARRRLTEFAAALFIASGRNGRALLAGPINA